MFKDYAEKFYHVKHTEKVFESRQKRMNQTIYIKNLFFYAADSDKSNGEFSESDHKPNMYSKNTAHSSMFRQVDLIKFIADMSNSYHQEHYCQGTTDGGYVIKQEYENHITRALLPEFSLYGADPLSWLEFNRLVKRLSKAARYWYDNVHVLASSLAVIHNDTIFNIALYIQGGSNALVTGIVKAKASRVDVSYCSTNNFIQNPPWPPHITKPTPEPNHLLTSFVGEYNNSSSFILSSDCVFTVRTKGGAEYVQAIEICLAHNLGHAKYLFEQKLKLTAKQDTQLIPEQVDHVVTSNSTPTEKCYGLAKCITHIDSLLTRTAQFHSRLHEDIFVNDDMLHNWRHNYNALNVVNASAQCTIENPPFGSDLHLIVTQSHALTSFNTEFADSISAHNQQIIQAQLNWHVGAHLSCYKKLCSKRSALLQTFAALYAQLTAQCRQALDVTALPQHTRPNLSKSVATVTEGAALQQLFNVITNSERTLSEGTTHDQDFILFNAVLLCNDLIFQIEKFAKAFSQFPVLTTLATELIFKINSVQHIVTHQSKEIFSTHSTNHDEHSEDEDYWSNVVL